MVLPEHGTFAVCGGTTYQVASASASTVTLRVPGGSGPLPAHVEAGVRQDGDRWVTVVKSGLERYFNRRVRVQWKGEEFELGRVDSDIAEIHGDSPAVADRLGLEGDQYNGFHATVPVGELTVVDVREKEIDV
jgi:hypothetical protein